jgi:tight adherence protein B
VNRLGDAGPPIYAAGLCLGLGLTGLAVVLSDRRRSRSGPPDAGAGSTPPSPTRRSSPTARLDLRSAAVSAVAGVVAVLMTDWPVAGPITAVAVYGLPRLLRRTSAASSIAKLEAIATWTELLQGTLAASTGLGQAIVATAELSPAVIRVATQGLAAQIQAGVDPRAALLQFAEDVGDPSADRVVCSLLLAFTERAQRLGDLLGALAESTRDEVALRLRVETSRASVRSGVRTVVVFSVLFAAVLALLARPYLAPYGSPGGQVVLGVVGALYAAGLTLLVTLARPPRSIRLLGTDVVEQ